MKNFMCFLGVVTYCDKVSILGKFLREDGQILENLQLPLSGFSTPPSIATVVIAKAKTNSLGPSLKLDLRFRAATLEECSLLDRISFDDAMEWIANTDI